tara:strand:- start:97 stop:1044 length:948 start_codon:yes stop_codon:yes gene_type:complete
MIVVGGLTRLTDSGLSITKWELFKGILPPLNENQWDSYFSEYKKIPEFIYLNSNITIDQFKIIFYWEFFHRLLGRFIGIFSLIPLLFFFYKYKNTDIYLKKYLSIFVLVLIQGFIGWFMVESGLTERIDVSHFRLALHLSLAFIILSLSFWFILQLSNVGGFNNKLPNLLLILLFFLLFCQIIFGAFLAGLDGGLIYNTWPDMNGYFFPDDIRGVINSDNLLSTPSFIQFLHRKIAYILLILILYFNYVYFRKKLPIKPILVFNTAIFIQIFLGIITLLSGAKIVYASLHQIGSIFVISSFLYIAYKNTKLTNSF